MSEYHLGIDVSKGYADFAMIDLNKKAVVPNFQLDDTFDGHNRLFEFFSQFFTEYPDSVVYAAVESTGAYENNWFSLINKFQADFPVKVARINPKGVCHQGKADLQRIVTDKISAKTIAEYTINYPEKVSYQAEDYFYPIRRKWNFIQSLIKGKTKFLNQLESLIYDANPELLVYCRHGVPNWILKLLMIFPTASILEKADVESIKTIPYIRKRLAPKLIERAQRSVASANDWFTEDTIKRTAEEILRLDQLIKNQVKLLIKCFPLNEIQLLKTFKSIGDTSAIGLLIHIGAIERFLTAKHISSFYGLHPVFKKSGDGTTRYRMSKQGRGEVRAILYMVALNAIVHNPLIKEVYIHNREKGKTKMDAIGVCMHKILRIVYGMLKNQQPFNPEIDRQNREASKHKKQKATIDRSRRFQKPDENAPISRRQNKKRKEQELSQNGNSIVCEINVLAPSQH